MCSAKLLLDSALPCTYKNFNRDQSPRKAISQMGNWALAFVHEHGGLLPLLQRLYIGGTLLLAARASLAYWASTTGNFSFLSFLYYIYETRL